MRNILILSLVDSLLILLVTGFLAAAMLADLPFWAGVMATVAVIAAAAAILEVCLLVRLERHGL